MAQAVLGRRAGLVAIAALVLALASLLVGAAAYLSLPDPSPADQAFRVDPSTGALELEHKSDAQLHHRYAGMLVRQPQGEETAGILIDMSGRSELFNEGIHIYTDSGALDYTTGIQVHNVGAADAIHVNLGCKGCSEERLNYTNTGIGIDQWSNGTGFFTFVHGGGKGFDGVLYPSAKDALLTDFRAASPTDGSGTLLRIHNAGNPNVSSLLVDSGWTRLRDVHLDGNLHVGIQVAEDTHAIAFTQVGNHSPALDANEGWLRVIDASAADTERLAINASSGDVRLSGHLGAGMDDGVRTTDASGRMDLTFTRPYYSVPLVSCTPRGAYACWIAEATPERVSLQVTPLAPDLPLGSVRLDVIVRGI